jgi:hypothetical protein
VYLNGWSLVGSASIDSGRQMNIVLISCISKNIQNVLRKN